ncbi:unnamed protein product [Periconia digitata]|uniref:RNA-dependent RNA polymerase n=1 Tax=Periconia digitata TaxID=1303443 RepID=A0A9W4XLM8_9PLEO|nr:unnamed protein product [Periconia digitata]
MGDNAAAPARVPGRGVGLAAVSTPNTPRKNGAGLNQLVQSLENKWHLGLEIRDDTWSPEKDTKHPASQVYGRLKRLYYALGPGLQQALDTFDELASGFAQEMQLGLLHGILKSKIDQTPPSKKRTPSSLRHESNLPRKPLKPLQFSPGRSPASTSPTKTTNSHRFESQPLYQTAPDPGSPTDDDDEEYLTPPSPTLSSRSAQRRVQASSRFCLDNKSIKRPFDGIGACGSSPKLTKTFKDPEWPPKSKMLKPSRSITKKYPFDSSRSFETNSVRTSFNGSFGAASSVQSNRPDTAATSFASDANDGDVEYPTLPKNLNSLPVNDQLAEDIRSRQEYDPPSSQDLGVENSSTYGSLDEDVLVNTSHNIEIKSVVSAGSSNTAPPRNPPSGKGVPLYPWCARKEEPASYKKSNGSSSTHRPQPSINNNSHQPAAQTSASPPSHNTNKLLGQNDNTSLAKGEPATSGLPWYIREIPKQHLFVNQISESLEKFPYFILFICCRIASENIIPMEDLMRPMNHSEVEQDPEFLWGRIDPEIMKHKERDPQDVWPAARTGFEGFTFKGTVSLNKKSTGPLFQLKLLPVDRDKSYSKPDRFTQEQWRSVQDQWKSWYLQEHTFLGRQWRAFLIEPIKKKKKKIDRVNDDDDYDKRLVLFATNGPDIEPISLGEMVNWHMDLKANEDQNFCKAYARLDLALSRTIPTLVFKPSQIRFVKDQLADGVAEDLTFSDPTLRAVDQKISHRAVMNDGCSRISVGAALEIWKIYRKVTGCEEGLPSIFQGRIGGAKGVWMLCGEPSTTDPNELAIWIEITESQLKFNPHDEDKHDHSYDKHRTTFEYLNHSSRPCPSTLHMSFISILVDRGVPREVIARLANDRLDIDRAQLERIISDPQKLHRWIHSQSPPQEHVLWEAALPKSLSNKIRYMLQSGFYPEDEPYLSEQLCKYINLQHIQMEQRLKIPLGRATFLFGVADPLGVLNPGEVHVEFSTPFVDETTGCTFRALNNIDLLVARQPACRRSDIQKVRAVKRPELAHLVDVVVFPSRGQYPMAGKLQGGDYDGDIFWLCWEPVLAGPFKNAPAPLDAPDPSKYGIRKETRKLREVMNTQDLRTVDGFLREALDFRFPPSLLGLVTNFHEKRAYMENRIHSWQLDALCDTHDLLVDALKQGYIFDKEAYTKLVEVKLRCGNPAIPSYKQAMEACKSRRATDDTDNPRERDFKHNPGNVLDFLYFGVVRRHNIATLQKVKDGFVKEDCNDDALRYPSSYLYKWDNQDKEQEQDQDTQKAIWAELASASTELLELKKLWDQLNREDKHTFAEVLEICYSKYQSILPSNPTLEVFKPLLRPYLNDHSNLWEDIRASTLYSAFGKPKSQSFVWHMAGRELMKLKCMSIPESTVITASILANLKPKPTKVPKPKEEEEDDEERKEEESQTEFLNDMVL